MLAKELMIIEKLSQKEWYALCPMIILSIFSLLSLLLVPGKGSRPKLAFWAVIIGGLLALGSHILGSKDVIIMQDLFVFDGLGNIFSISILLSLLGSCILCFDFVKREQLLREVFPLLGFSAVGMLVMVSTRDLFIFFLGLEVASLGIYILVGSERYAKHSAEAALKYFLLGGAASSLFLFGVSLFYGVTGTTAFSGFLQAWDLYKVQDTFALLPLFALLMLLAGFIFKLGGFPLHFWLPDVYSGAPAPITGFMISAMKAAAVGGFLRFSADVLAKGAVLTVQSIIYWIFVCVIIGSMLFGALVGMQQKSLKRMFAYSSIVHSGFIFLGIFALVSSNTVQQEAFEAIACYIIFYVMANLSLFAAISSFTKSESLDVSMEELASLGKVRPWMALAISVCLFSLAGLPLTGGFLGKYLVLSVGLASGHWFLVLFGALASMLSVGFYLRPLAYMYMSSESALVPEKSLGATLVMAFGVLALVIFAIF